MTLKRKILGLVIIPILLVVLSIMAVVYSNLSAKQEKDIQQLREQMLEEKRSQLQSYVEIALTSLDPLTQGNRQHSTETKEHAADILRAMRFGANKNGYIFAYEMDGTVLVLGPKPELEGKNLIDLTDSNGSKVVARLLNAAKKGGDFVDYPWPKPSTKADAPKLSYATKVPAFNWMIGTGFYIDDIDEALADIQARSHSEMISIVTTIAIVGVLLTLAAIAVSTLLLNKAIKPLRDTAAALADISQGEGDLTRRLEVTTTDEVGQVASGFNQFVDKIQALITDISHGITALSQSVAEMNTVTSHTHSNVDRQRNETGLAAAAVHEMAAAAQEVAQNAANAADAAQQADSESNVGLDTVNQTIAAINDLSGEVNHAADVISSLQTNAEQIGNVVNVINDIADQTNLLALNAAIEAARAGEQGRGFSVVADEVRTLANRTQQSTDEIRSMIESLQQGSQQAVKVMQNSQEKSQNTVEQAAQASHSLNTIAESVGTITQMNTQIASAAEEQTSVAEEISQNVQQVSDIAEDSANSAEALSTTATELSALEKRLADVVNQFKI